MVKRPVRRKYRDNSYTLNYIEEKNMYTIKFKDVRGYIHEVEVTEEVYRAFNSFELHDIKELNEYDRHIEHSEIIKRTIESRMKYKAISLEDDFVRKNIFEELKNAIQSLPEVQKRRIKKYYFEDKTYEEIAKEEGCSKVAIKYSIDIAIEKISKKFQKWT